jgi:hypothetical protein
VTTTTTLTAAQAAGVARARAVLAGEPSCEPGDMAARIGRLEYHLAEMLALAGELAPGE